MKTAILPSLLIATFCSQAHAAVSVTTSIDVQAEISTVVSVYINGHDVTNKSIGVTMQEASGYMQGSTPPIHFIGNASSVDLSLSEPPAKGLTGPDNTVMALNTSWYNPKTGGEVSTSYPFSDVVYPTLQDVPDMQKGVKLNFKSAARSETFPLGTYSGTYTITVRPKV
ncbi:hypothetical protein [Intestinirhabdus alba]|jgi:hypothetical protein|uniref:Fimbrial protein n=1 Tax=Intestinirhabdus alba TaxID=2899544 RepID=A0A6L6IG25_9ENTR|nr:hypothetical protein [Intestinirhabdus alba]MTH45589.1 hypothetical protein [Intestinirhabdus alba]